MARLVLPLALSVPVRDAWLRKLDDEQAHVLASELAKVLGAPPAREKLAPAPPTLDDTLARAGLHADSVAALESARAALDEDEALARDTAREIGARTPGSPAALLVLAAAGIDDDPEDALRAVERVLRVLPGHVEALGLRALAELRLGRLEQAGRDATAALASRADAPVASYVRGRLATLEGASARELDLAAVLASGDRALERRISRARKAAGGPWTLERTKRRVTPHYVVLTDTDDETADTVASVVEDAHARFERSFGRARAPRRGSVLVFDTQAAFKEWADQVMPGSGDHTGGFYDPFHDQLCVYQPPHDPGSAWTRCVTVHEAFHEYAFHAIGGVPVWLNEGLAESFGIEVAYGGRAGIRAYGIETCLAKHRDRKDWRHFFRISYGEFHATGVRGGQKDEHANYARAFLTARLLREGKGPLESVLDRLVAAIRDGAEPDAILTDAVVDALEKGFEPCARRALAE